MSTERQPESGELIALDRIAECFRVEVEWVEEVYDLGLLGHGRRIRETVAVSFTALDRVAEILRLHRHCGVNLAGVALFLRERPPVD